MNTSAALITRGYHKFFAESLRDIEKSNKKTTYGYKRIKEKTLYLKNRLRQQLVSYTKISAIKRPFKQ